jgi:hypothetical protein
VSTKAATAKIRLVAGDPTLKVGEKRWLNLTLTSDVAVASAIVALRFDPKVVKVVSVTAGTLLSTTKDLQSIDSSGLLLVSVSNLNGSTKGTGTLFFIELEALAAGEAGFSFDQAAMHLLGPGAHELALDVAPVGITIKQ